MSKVRIERLASRKREKYGPNQKQEAFEFELGEQSYGTHRIEYHQDNVRILEDLIESQTGYGGEPKQHHGSVDLSYRSGPLFLKQENDRQDNQRYRYD